MKTRILVYLGIISIFSLGVGIKMGVIDRKRAAPVSSILNEWQTHGKPVEIYTVSKGPISFRERLTATVTEQGSLSAQVSRATREKLKPGMPATILSGEEPLRGRVQRVDMAANRATGLYSVQLEALEQKPAKGANLVVDVETSRISDVVRVPTAAVQRGEKESSVWRLENGKAEPVPIQLGRSSGEFVQVVDGLKPGDRVVVRGQALLEPKESVRVIGTGELK